MRRWRPPGALEFGTTNGRIAPLATMLVALAGVAGCTSQGSALTEGPPQKLSDYGLFVGNGNTQEPVPGVVPYDLNSPLFSDYADKLRFVRLPAGQSAQYRADETFEFPVGTVIAKTFAYPADARRPTLGRRLIETRILKHEPQGWVGLPYIWNAEQTEAVLEVAGDLIDVRWVDVQGTERTNNYIVPNVNQCKGCHKQGDAMQPIGLKARHLNRDFAYAHGSENQLAFWTRSKALSGSPDPKDAPRAAVWNDPDTGTLDQRARAWLEVNCAHCHNSVGPARNAGLDLMAAQQGPTKFGIFKTPVAAGRGSGSREFDIVPGQPEQSIMMFRITSIDPGIMMPELGKRLIHEEGVELVRQWIASMPTGGPPSPIP
jgi:uncharacterized repeat protein (TIGR03806 family)